MEYLVLSLVFQRIELKVGMCEAHILLKCRTLIYQLGNSYFLDGFMMQFFISTDESEDGSDVAEPSESHDDGEDVFMPT